MLETYRSIPSNPISFRIPQKTVAEIVISINTIHKIYKYRPGLLHEFKSFDKQIFIILNNLLQQNTPPKTFTNFLYPYILANL